MQAEFFWSGLYKYAYENTHMIKEKYVKSNMYTENKIINLISGGLSKLAPCGFLPFYYSCNLYVCNTVTPMYGHKNLHENIKKSAFP